MKTYTLKLKTTSTVDYNLYDGTTLVSDTDLGTLFTTAGEAYFVFDFNSLTPTNTTALNIVDSNGNVVVANTGLTGIAENKNFKGTWAASATAFTTFEALTGVAMDEAQLLQLMGVAKSKIKSLTTADYNWNSTDRSTTGTLDSIAVWLLEPGVYQRTGAIDLWYGKYGHIFASNYYGGILVVGTGYNASPVQNYRTFLFIGHAPNTGQQGILRYGEAEPDYGSLYESLKTTEVFRDVNKTIVAIGAQTIYNQYGARSVQVGRTLSAQGEEAIAIGSSASAPTTRSIAIGNSGNHNGHGPCPFGPNSIAIGYYARDVNQTAGVSNAIMLGSGASANRNGQMDISTTNIGNVGYNGSTYRLLTGLYDPQDAHDAATKGYVDGLVGDIETALNAINNGGNA